MESQFNKMVGEPSNKRPLQKTEPGKIIVFEGPDYSGKTTISNVVKTYLEKMQRNVKIIKFPTSSGKIGMLLHQYLSGNHQMCDRVVQMLFSANRWEENQYIRDLVNSGTHLIIDRYTFSGWVYGASKVPPVDLEWSRGLDHGLPRPCIVILLDIDPKIALERRLTLADRYENEAFQVRVRVKYLELAREDDRFHVVDANCSLERVAKSVLEIINASVL